MVPKNEVWSRKVSETKAIVPEVYRKAMVGVPGWYREANGAEKRDLECWKGTGKRRVTHTCPTGLMAYPRTHGMEGINKIKIDKNPVTAHLT